MFHNRWDSVLCLCRCTICLGEYQEKEILRIMPKCGHKFHLSCIDVWLRKQSTCPVCRLPLQEIFDAKRATPEIFGTTQSVDNAEISSEHFHQWLLPGPERSVENGRNQEQPGSLSGNLEPVLPGDTEMGRWSKLFCSKVQFMHLLFETMLLIYKPSLDRIGIWV